MLVLVRLITWHAAYRKHRYATEREQRTSTQHMGMLMYHLSVGKFDISRLKSWVDSHNFCDIALALCCTNWTAVSLALMDGTQEPR